MQDDYKELLAIETAKESTRKANQEFNQPKNMIHAGKAEATPDTKTIGQKIMESKAVNKNTPVDIDIDLKTLFQTSAGWAPESLREPRVIDYAVRALMVTDFIPSIPTSQAAVKYMEETTFTNNAAEAAEGAAVGEAALKLSERSQTVEKVGTFIPITEEQLEDVPAAQAYINNRLGYMVLARLDSQVLNGDGSTPNLKGTLNIGGSLQTQAKGSDPTPDAFYKGMVLVRTVGFAQPSVIFINPNDWQDIRLLRTADGIYIFGSPNDAGPERLWGVPVVQTTAVVEDTGILGDYANYSALYMRRGIEIEMSSGYSDYFVKGKFAMKATMRCAMVHYRTSAFCTITGI
jgi:HK97 family phage major capsid protein